MIGSEVLVALIAILVTATGMAAAALKLATWIVKRQDKRQDSTIDNNTAAIDKNNRAYMALAESINKSTAASQSLEGSIRKRDEQDREFQTQVLSSFSMLNSELKSVVEITTETLNAVKPASGDGK